MTERLFKGFLVLNWRTGQMKVYSREPSKHRVLPSQIVIRVEIKCTVPDAQTFIARGEIEIPPQKVKEMLIEEL
jgi:hypothetical protein